MSDEEVMTPMSFDQWWDGVLDSDPRSAVYTAREFASKAWNAALAARPQQDAEQAIRDVWPHLTGHCFEGATPKCFGKMRDILSAVVPNLPYAHAHAPSPSDDMPKEKADD